MTKIANAPLPAQFDWRTHKPSIITPVKDQGQCGSCWAFSTTGNIEGQWALAGHPLTSLSEQSLVDCCQECYHPGVCDQGCEGGLMANTFLCVIKSGGIDTEKSYPYIAKDGFCKFNPANIGSKIESFAFIPQTPEEMAYYLVHQGPIAVAADASQWQFYRSGVFEGRCGTQINHAILLVGYGEEQNSFGKVDYWLIKNSWGAKWGMAGYMKLPRGGNVCGLEEYPITSLVNAPPHTA